MPRNDPRSEYEGGGLLPSTVFPKGDDALTPDDKLRLQSITGQDRTAKAPPDPWHWQGWVDPGPPPEWTYADEQEALADPGRYE